MKKKIWTVIFLIFICVYSYAQRGSKTGAAPAATTTPATATQGSGSTTLMQGYHYRLDRNYHIGYKSILYTSVGSQVQNLPGQSIKIYNIFDYILKDSVTKTDGTVPKVYPKNVFYPGDSLRVEVIACHWNEGSVHDTKDVDKEAIIIRDTISRYYLKKLWISVTQGDSGKLVIQFYNTGIQKQFWKKGETFQGIGMEFNPDLATNIKKNFSNLIDTSKFHVALGGDKTLNTAIPINNLDSAQNFFLKIKNKVHFSDPLYYISLPYYVWQYGAATIPFKLRFGNSKQIINSPDIHKSVVFLKV